jgi:hypothetical protein
MADGGSFAFLQVKRRKTVDAFFSKVEIHSLFVAGLWLHSKPRPPFRPDSASIRRLSLSTSTRDHRDAAPPLCVTYWLTTRAKHKSTAERL